MKRLLLFLSLAFLSLPLYSKGLDISIDDATNLFAEFEESKKKSIPSEVIRRCKGIAIISELKGGVIFSAKKGSGFVIMRTKNHWGWSAPSSLSIEGLGLGPQIGARHSFTVFILNTDKAVDKFSKSARIAFGSNVSLVGGPIGKTLSLLPKADIYTYNFTEGGYIGGSMDANLIHVKNKANKNFYNKKVTHLDLVTGKVTPPKEATKLYKIINKYQNLY